MWVFSHCNTSFNVIQAGKTVVNSNPEEINDCWKYLINGDIIISCNKEYIGISAYSLTKLKDTAWFNQTIYVDDFYNIVSKETEGSKAVTRRIWPTT